MIEAVVRRHLEEAAGCAVMRRHGVTAPSWTFANVERVDERIDAHLEGLALAGQGTWGMIREAQRLGDDGEAFVAGWFAAQFGGEQPWNVVLSLAQQSVRRRNGLAFGVAWHETSRVADVVTWLLAGDVSYRALAFRIASAASLDVGAALEYGVRDPDVRVRAAAIECAGRLGRVDLAGPIVDSLASPDPALRGSAAAAGSRLGVVLAVGALREIALVEPEAADLVVRCMTQDAATGWLARIFVGGAAVRATLAAVGGFGDPTHIDWLIGCMSDPALARPAAAAFAMVTGADLQHEGLVKTPAVPGAAPMPAVDLAAVPPPMRDIVSTALRMMAKAPRDVRVGGLELPVPSEDAGLPEPDADRVRAWWASRRPDFHGGTRYLAGRPIDDTACVAILETGNQRQRRAAALELAIADHTRVLFDVGARADIQRAQIDPLRQRDGSA